MKKVKSSSFKLNPIAASIVLAMASQFSSNLAYGNAGYGVNTNIAGQTIAVPTYYANSPQGWQPALGANNLPITNPATGKPYTAAEAFAANGNSVTGAVPMINTGTPLRKFVDPLAGAYYGVDGAPTLGVSMGLPIGIPDKWVDANGVPINGNSDDYYEIACVEYTEQMHSDLAKPTRLRGYVQIETPYIAAGAKDITGVVGSEHIALKYPDGSQIYRMIKDPTTGLMVQDKTQPVYAVHAPHYLGPTLLVQHGKPIRILFHNYLPYRDINGNSVGSDRGLGGDMTIPVDEFLAGGGPLVKADGTPLLDNNGQPMKFSQNRISVHWHGGDSPWTNDGTPHEWYAPAGDASWSVKDPTHPNGLGVGDSFHNVPDMPDPGPGSQTMYFPNQTLSGRLMMYHDHASGITRLNAYYGMAAGYLVYDDPTNPNGDIQLAATALGTSTSATTTLTSGPLKGATLPTGLLDAVGIPLVIQDKVFVPNNIGTVANSTTPGPNNPNLPYSGAKATNGQFQSQDAKWDLDYWGQPGDLYFPHVYETNQDPNSIDGTNPVGRWDWGPWFWPVFPSQYSLPSGNYGDVTTTPEAFVDTPIVNGQAYPTLTLDPKTYRFRILSIGNDRTFNFGLYEAVDGAGPGKAKVCDTVPTSLTYNASPTANPTAPGQPLALSPATCTEIAMVPASVPVVGTLSAATGLDISKAWPANYPTDGRAGGVPDPTTAGPDIVQIGNEAGLLPAPAIWPAQPVTYDQNVRSMTIYNVLHHQLLLAGAERADVLIDFSKYAGKTLILYNDAPAPLPGFDPRIDYFTGVGDQTQGGGAYDTLPGYGPNTRTIMQFIINPTNTSGTGGPLNVPALQAALPVAYAATQPPPNVPERVYNTAFNANYQDNYAHIFTGSSTAPAFLYPAAGVRIGSVDPVTGFFTTANAVTVTNPGSGYTTAPQVTIAPPMSVGGQQAIATATIGNVTLANGTVVTGAVTGVNITNPGSGYMTVPAITIAAPLPPVQATFTANRGNRNSISGFNAVSPGFGGYGYSATNPPTVTFSQYTATTATATYSLTYNASNVATGYKITVTTATPATIVGTLVPYSNTLRPQVTATVPTTCKLSGGATPQFSLASPSYNKKTGVLSISVDNSNLPLTNACIPIITIADSFSPATATATVNADTSVSLAVTQPGWGYPNVPTVTVSAPPPVTQSQAQASITASSSQMAVHVINKAIQELFDPVYGRMNATLAVELPYSNATVATTIPLAYIDAPIDDPTNILANMDGIHDGETQIWKITHNGVDSHPVHFHLVNVQVINRVDWAGVVKPPEPNEVGWRETLRMNPLEDVYVAVKAVHPVVPFGLPRSQRVLDPSQAVGSQLGFTQIDQLTGNAPACQAFLTGGLPNPYYVNGSISCATKAPNGAAVTPTGTAVTAYSNQLTDFDNEYVWHCHILGHEENDFMRPFIFHPNVEVPDAPAPISVSGSTVTWTDTTPYGGQDSKGRPTAGLDANGNASSSPMNEIGFKIIDDATQTVYATVPANTTSWTDTTGNLNLQAVKVVAYNSAGESSASLFTASTCNPSPCGSTAAVTGGAAAATAAATAAVNAAATAVSAATTAAAAAATTAATTAAANTTANALVAAATTVATPVAFGVSTSTMGKGAISLTWANNPSNVVLATGLTNVSGYTLSWSDSSGAALGKITLNGTSNIVTVSAAGVTPAVTATMYTGLPTGATVTGLTSGGSYNFNLVANATAGSSAAATITGALVP